MTLENSIPASDPGTTGRIGILLSNLGTPEAPTAGALRPYLREFLSDRRVVDLPRPVWWVILHAFILPFRPGKVAPAYRKIWTDRGSPLMATAEDQRDALQERFKGDAVVTLGMRYGRPSIATALGQLTELGCRRVLHLPLYPQYAAATTATNNDALFAAMAKMRWSPAVRTINQYDDDPAYIAALAASVRETWDRDGEPDRLLMSFHGIPQRYWDQGDPYPVFCQRTGKLLGDALGLERDRYEISFQSRFGREPWVQPYTDQTLAEWGAAGVGAVDVICPGFSADCLETLEEIDMQNRAIFEGAGGERFRYIRALNARSDHIDALEQLIRRHLAGWE